MWLAGEEVRGYVVYTLLVCSKRSENSTFTIVLIFIISDLFCIFTFLEDNLDVQPKTSDSRQLFD